VQCPLFSKADVLIAPKWAASAAVEDRLKGIAPAPELADDPGLFRAGHGCRGPTLDGHSVWVRSSAG